MVSRGSDFTRCGAGGQLCPGTARLKVDTWTSGLGALALFPVLTVLYVWKYDFHLWQRSVEFAKILPAASVFLSHKDDSSGFKSKDLEGLSLAGTACQARNGRAHVFSLPTSHSAQHQSPSSLR